MNQDISIEQMEDLLKEPTKPSRKQALEATVKQRTPHYVILNNPQYDQELMEAHIELATIYNADGAAEQAYSHLRAAEDEFFNMCRVETRQPLYILGGKEGFQRFREQKRSTERRLEGYKARLVETAQKIGYDRRSLISIPTSDSPKSDLVKEIMDYVR